jgi:hypothetical protein
MPQNQEKESLFPIDNLKKNPKLMAYLLAILGIPVSLLITSWFVFRANACGESRVEFEGYGIRSVLFRKEDCSQPKK